LTSGAGSGPDVDPDRRAALVASRLLAVASRSGLTDVVALTPAHPRGAAVRGTVGGREHWWIEHGSSRPNVGATLAWASARPDWNRQSLTIVHGGSAAGVADADVDGPPTDARRARLFALEVDVRRLAGGEAAMVGPAPHAPSAVTVDEHLHFAAIIESAGADVVVEHGVVAGEVAGLEVCRVVDDPATGAPRLEVGIGEHDRETYALMHGHRPTEESLASVVGHVAAHRAPGAAPHPLNRIARARLLRARAVGEPGLVGADVLRPTEPPVARTNLKDPVPCLAAREDGSLVCFVAGVDLEAVPFLLDAVDRAGGPTGRSPSLAICSRDLVPALARVAMLSAAPVEIILLPDGIG